MSGEREEQRTDAVRGDAEQRGIRLVVSFDRLWESDRDGSVEVECSGVEEWHYANIGSFHGMQGESEGEDPRVMEFGARLADMVREHFGAVRPLTDR